MYLAELEITRLFLFQEAFVRGGWLTATSEDRSFVFCTDIIFAMNLDNSSRVTKLTVAALGVLRVYSFNCD